MKSHGTCSIAVRICNSLYDERAACMWASGECVFLLFVRCWAQKQLWINWMLFANLRWWDQQPANFDWLKSMLNTYVNLGQDEARVIKCTRTWIHRYSFYLELGQAERGVKETGHGEQKTADKHFGNPCSLCICLGRIVSPTIMISR